MSRRLVVVGLGNYTHPLTRHSIGQILVDRLSSRAASFPTSTSTTSNGQLLLNKSHPAFISTTTLTTSSTTAQGIALPPLSIMFVKPRVLMNISGPAIVSASRSFLPPSATHYRIITLQDDLDLASQTHKTQRGGSPRGHNGVRSLSKSLAGSREFYRIRIGVGRPLGGKGQGEAISDWVMGALGRDEVRACEEGKVLEGVWNEILRIGWEEESALK